MEDQPARKICVECGEPIIGVIPKHRNGQPVCRNCTFGSRPAPPLDPKVVAQVTKSARKGAPRGHRKTFLATLTFLLLLGALVTVPLLSSGIDKERPLRTGGVKTDRMGDECVQNLWILSRALQEDGADAPPLACPASGVPYEYLPGDGDTVIRCPSPQRHKVTELLVSRLNPFPVVIP